MYSYRASLKDYDFIIKWNSVIDKYLDTKTVYCLFDISFFSWYMFIKISNFRDVFFRIMIGMMEAVIVNPTKVEPNLHHMKPYM